MRQELSLVVSLSRQMSLVECWIWALSLVASLSQGLCPMGSLNHQLTVESLNRWLNPAESPDYHLIQVESLSQQLSLVGS
jgi:hypothetical protein